MARKVKEIANRNIEVLGKILSGQTPLLGIEPSAVPAFRGGYTDLVIDRNIGVAKSLATHTTMIDDFLEIEVQNGNVIKQLITDTQRLIQLPGHCQRKAMSSINALMVFYSVLQIIG